MSSEPGGGARLERRDLEALFTARFADLMAEDFIRRLPADIWNEGFFRSNELLNLYTDFQVWTILERLGVKPEKPGAGPARSPADPPEERGGLDGRGVPAARQDSIRWLQAKASGSAFARNGVRGLTADSPDGFGRRLEEAILLDDPGLAPCLKLVDLAASGYPGFLRGEIEGRTILFSPATHDLWESYFDPQNPFYQPVNRLAAHAAGQAVTGEALRVLEVGAGCGSGTVTLLEELAHSPPQRLVVTDISPNFLRKARSRVEEAAGRPAKGIEFRFLDLNRPRDTWRLADGEFHLVFAVNVLHCVRDLVGALAALRLLLRPGGALVLGEGLRPSRGRPVHPEFIFQLLDEFRDVAVHPAHRPDWGFLDGPGWRGSLAEAGFADITILPDVDRLAECYREHGIAAIVARA